MTRTVSSARAVPLALLSVMLLACPGSDDPMTTVTASEGTTATPDGTTTTGGQTTADEQTTGEPPTTGEPGETTSAVDPCDACSPDATCAGGVCTCKDGFVGDGETCDDFDECASGKDNECSIDATCSNEPGSYDCACNNGYEGDGFECKDVDECAEDLHNCSPLAECTNQDGEFQCECLPGYTGDGVSCMGDKDYGESCEIAEECASGICLDTNPGQCTVTCTITAAHDCRDQGVSGLCVQTAQADLFVCSGDFNGGPDKDDTVLQAGDSAMRTFNSKTDADLFLVNHGTLDSTFVATPDPDDDIQLEVYGSNGVELGTVNNVGVGMAEGGVLEVGGMAGYYFVVVRNIGNSNGTFKIEISEQ